jgi:hypothetical protein
MMQTIFEFAQNLLTLESTKSVIKMLQLKIFVLITQKRKDFTTHLR